MGSTRKFEGRIQDNYDSYLKSSHRIGFIESFPVTEVLEEFKIPAKCRAFNVVVNVKYCTLSFGGSEFTVRGLVTDIVSISKYLPMGGFNSNCYYDEAETMEKAIIEVCKLKNLMICAKISSWPFAKASVQDNFYKD